MESRQQARLCQQASIPAELTVGLDEAGRGCLAGPVAAAAVILPEQFNLPKLNDSKKLAAATREWLAPKIRSCAIAYSLGVVWPRRIETINILQAALEAMARAVGSLKANPRLLLIDGNVRIGDGLLQNFWHREAALPAQKAIVHGDALIPAIAAASILAKTFRDRLMIALARRWPGYGFEKHKGYGTKAHLAALQKLGPCPLHRRTFRGVKPLAELLL